LFPILSFILLVLISLVIYFYHIEEEGSLETLSAEYYSVPYVPFTPLLGVLINYYLLAQLSGFGLLLTFSYLFCAIVFYYSYGFNYSIGNRTKWNLSLSRSMDSSSVSSHSPVQSYSSSIVYDESYIGSNRPGLKYNNSVECSVVYSPIDININ
jgi:hypothetical protein